jgi:hypothetical protein
MTTQENNYTNSHKLFEIILRMPKNDTSFVYFTLEANENKSFYSTLPFEKGQLSRDMVIMSTPEFKDQLLSIIEHCKKTTDIEILSQQFIDDE